MLILPRRTSSRFRADLLLQGLNPPVTVADEKPRNFEARWICDSGHELDQSGRAFLPATLPIVMGSKSDVATYLVPQDPKILKNTQPIQERFTNWYPNRLHQIEIQAAEAIHPQLGERGVGCFFSGGVDSLYSAITRRDEITHLIFVLGFDIPLTDKDLCAKAVEEAKSTAAELGKELVVIRTTIRRASGKYAKWGPIYHGAALATVGLLLCHHIKHAIIPSSSPLEALHPWGTHPDLDYLWSTNYLHFEHHGTYKSRNEKLALIANSNYTPSRLRVCWENRNGKYNCGKCEKCMRTMLPLYAMGKLHEVTSLPNKIDIDALARMRFAGTKLNYAQDTLQLLRDTVRTDDPVLKTLIESITASLETSQ